VIECNLYTVSEEYISRYEGRRSDYKKSQIVTAHIEDELRMEGRCMVCKCNTNVSCTASPVELTP